MIRNHITILLLVLIATATSSFIFIKNQKIVKMKLTNKEKIQELYKSFATGDPTAAQLYLKPDYIQHNPNIGNGIQGFADRQRARCRFL